MTSARGDAGLATRTISALAVRAMHPVTGALLAFKSLTGGFVFGPGQLEAGWEVFLGVLARLRLA